jgi:hypothetical protein
MSYLSLLVASVTPGISNRSTASREIEPEVFASSSAAESAWNGTRGGADEYLLPSGIASLEHWLDLNA